jgi:predicted ATPase
MIQRLSISNFRSLGTGVSLELGPLTVLVGANSVGKSNVLDALRFVSDALHMGLSNAIAHRQGIRAVRRRSGGHPLNVSIGLDLDLAAGLSGHYSFELRGGSSDDYEVWREEALVRRGSEAVSFTVKSREWVEGPPGLKPSLDGRSLALSIVGGDARFQPLVHALQQISVYTIFPETLRAPQRYSPVKPMDRHGSNWASILKDQPKETWKPELVSALHKLTGDIDDITVTDAAGYLVVQFRHPGPGRKPVLIDATEESDGTLRFIGIVTALLQEPPVPVLGIEEPELTVHPGAIPLLYDFLKEASRRSQVLVTTHSPELLDLVDPEEVRVVLRGREGTTIGPMSAVQREAVRGRLLTLGEVLRAEGLQQDLPVVGAA